MVEVAGWMIASWFVVWTATITQCEVESYCVFPASPPSSICGDSVGRRIDYKVAPSRFVRDEDTPLHGRIRDPVREPRPGDARHDLKGGIVDDHNRVVAGRRGIRAVLGRHRQDTGHGGKSVQSGDNAPNAYVENDELPCAHVRDEQPP